MHPCNYRTAGEDPGVTYPSVEDSQEVCTTSFSTSPPSQLMVPGKEGGEPLVPNRPVHGAQADQERLAICTPSDGTHCAATPSSSEDTETVSNSSEGQASPHDVLETIFVRKVGAFVNKPINQKPAFSKDDILPMDLGTFYCEFQNPPQLSSLSIDIGAQSMAEDLDSLPEKLAVHEKNVREFDAFVETLQ
ncbi:autophagy protein 13 [Saguinus oedipus]|uniref:Autophagy protein 13 n=1 Tax=Saguinus oedipus TaxID=9490 RepID=A0ABQ9TZZ5_SAGOE|nr:autophagy protein 13 [Saguinus oedipus]